MPNEEQSARIEEVIRPVLGGHGLELVELEWRPRRPRSILRVFVDKPGGVGIGDCERVSREARGKRVRCWLYDGREVRGRLAEVASERLVVERDGERVELARAEVTKARLEAEVPWPRRG
jgi:ribosome maturation factor RimP